MSGGCEKIPTPDEVCVPTSCADVARQHGRRTRPCLQETNTGSGSELRLAPPPRRRKAAWEVRHPRPEDGMALFSACRSVFSQSTAIQDA